MSKAKKAQVSCMSRWPRPHIAHCVTAMPLPQPYLTSRGGSPSWPADEGREILRFVHRASAQYVTVNQK